MKKSEKQSQFKDMTPTELSSRLNAWPRASAAAAKQTADPPR
jgi:hypothetical protein